MHKLGGGAAFGDQNRRIARLVDPQIAVRCLGGMEEHRGGPRAAERRGELVGDVAGLAHSRYHDLAFGCYDKIHGFRNLAVKTLRGNPDSVGFGNQCRPRNFHGFDHAFQ